MDEEQILKCIFPESKQQLYNCWWFIDFSSQSIKQSAFAFGNTCTDNTCSSFHFLSITNKPKKLMKNNEYVKLSFVSRNNIIWISFDLVWQFYLLDKHSTT